MNNTEREPLIVANFRDVADGLSEDDGLFLSRNTVRHARAGVMGEPEPVHYEGMDTLSAGDRHIEGELVSGEFRKIAEWIYSDKDYVRQGPLYPVITVINNTTGDFISLPIDIAELIVHGVLPIYSRPAQSPGEGEVLHADLMPLIKDLIKEVGVEPNRSMVTKEHGIQALRDIDLIVETRLTQTFDVGDEGDFVFPANPRGEAALSLLQMDTAQTFISSNYRLRETYPGKVEVSLSVGTRPDLQTSLLELIDKIELRGEFLYCYKHSVTTDEVEFVVAVVNSGFQLVAELSRESALDIAMYNAYRAAWEKFPEQTN